MYFILKCSQLPKNMRLPFLEKKKAKKVTVDNKNEVPTSYMRAEIG